MEENTEKYSLYLLKLNRGYNKGLGRAPHKPILLLSILQLIRSGNIDSNKIFITSELVLAFKSNWNQLVETKHTPNFALPFFHMKSEPFWNLIPKLGMRPTITSSKSIKSFKNLNETIAYAEIDKALFDLFKSTKTSLILAELLLKNYFKASNFTLTETPQLQIEIEDQILNEGKHSYTSKIEELHNKLNEEEFEEEIFVRSGIFKKTIPKIYNYQCCISEMKIESTVNAQMIDACHIIPFSESHNDTIQNGISLSPNLHRAFDRGLLTISKDFIVRISPTVSDNNSVYSIRQFDGKQISLPINPKHYPSTESLDWHKKEIYQI
ncbi:HNH endonuclease [Lutibacter sp. TH_r2]|uniref:HNH endonuclease n=1 Tax=Lutibacter sp. TH_r2 TaxID=3082083 RepID=UPI00295514DF|nr:HNH endonuclease [Lutibacter sp. TH_r2]MDV7187413.1 HNH endonuclease [Lutibacter sp. TH_r2]